MHQGRYKIDSWNSTLEEKACILYRFFVANGLCLLALVLKHNCECRLKGHFSLEHCNQPLVGPLVYTAVAWLGRNCEKSRCRFSIYCRKSKAVQGNHNFLLMVNSTRRYGCSKNAPFGVLTFLWQILVKLVNFHLPICGGTGPVKHFRSQCDRPTKIATMAEVEGCMYGLSGRHSFRRTSEIR